MGSMFPFTWAPDDPQWIPRLKASDPTVMNELFTAYFIPMVGVATAILQRQDVAEELVQEALFTLWRRRDTLVIESSVRGYLLTMVRNAALNTIRAERVRANWRETPGISEDAAGAALPSHPVQPDAHIEQLERARLLHEAIASLPLKYRRVMALRANGFEYDTIADILELSVKTVRTQAGRGILLLRKALTRFF